MRGCATRLRGGKAALLVYVARPMIGLWILLTLQAAMALALGFLWRRHAVLRQQVNELRERLAAAEAPRSAARRARAVEASRSTATESGTAIVAVGRTNSGPIARAARAWGLIDRPQAAANAPAQSETTHAIALGIAAAAPGLGFFVGVATPLIVAIGLLVAMAMLLLGLRQSWRVGEWASVITAGAWAVLGFAIGAAQSAPFTYSAFVAMTGVAGLLHADRRSAGPGAVMALAMAIMALALASQVGMIGAAGCAFAAIVATAAIVGANSLRLEAMHMAAFGAALIGLFVLSGQEAAAIWFTPVAAWSGALFFAVAAVRVPQLGARGIALAGTGALAPLLAVAALHWARHGLADHTAAAGAFAIMALLLGGLIAVSAARRSNGISALKATLWVLTIASFIAMAAAINLALPPQLASPAYALVALGLCLLNLRIPDAAWRTFALVALACAAFNSFGAIQLALTESKDWPAWALNLTGLAAPAIMCGLATSIAKRAEARMTAGAFEAASLLLGVAAADLAVRLFFSEGATLLQPITFLEAGTHVSLWLLASLFAAGLSHRDTGGVRKVAALGLGAMALIAIALAGVLWLTPYWPAREPLREELGYAPLGFLAPALIAWAHWVFWRARGAEIETRLALGAGGLLLAGFATLEAVRWEGAPEWAGALVSAGAFVLAITLNFAPGVTARPRAQLYSDEDLHRYRRRQKRA